MRPTIPVFLSLILLAGLLPASAEAESIKIVASAAELSGDGQNGWRNAPCPHPDSDEPVTSDGRGNEWPEYPQPEPEPTPMQEQEQEPTTTEQEPTTTEPMPETAPTILRFCDVFHSTFCLNAAYRDLYDDTLYGHIVYNEYESTGKEFATLLPNVENYNIVLSTEDPGGRCTLATTDNKVQWSGGGGGSDGTGENLLDFIYPVRAIMGAASARGRIVENAWKGSISIYTGSAILGPGKIVVRFSSGPVPEELNNAIAYANIGQADGARVVFRLDGNCHLMMTPGAYANRVIRHEFGHALGFHHTSGRSVMSSDKYSVQWSSSDHAHIDHAYVLGNRAKRRPGFPGAIPDGYAGGLD